MPSEGLQRLQRLSASVKEEQADKGVRRRHLPSHHGPHGARRSRTWRAMLFLPFLALILVAVGVLTPVSLRLGGGGERWRSGVAASEAAIESWLRSPTSRRNRLISEEGGPRNLVYDEAKSLITRLQRVRSSMQLATLPLTWIPGARRFLAAQQSRQAGTC